jgi:hypothetical protein
MFPTSTIAAIALETVSPVTPGTTGFVTGGLASSGFVSMTFGSSTGPFTTSSFGPQEEHANIKRTRKHKAHLLRKNFIVCTFPKE